MTAMYTDAYLRATREKPITPSTFLHGELTGKAKKYSGGYLRRLVADLEARVEAGEVEKVTSVGNGVAYRAISQP